ncbi:flagellar biosynthetic protein FliU [Clostridium saccharobutylicum]|uniref:flagellin lysine-N-methylase n=1 Tax=Clostridium saccharobutylicum TaxID=169679 RepID=UPI000983CD63|nr:flagellin lysine-N-methylase [Clostridium saccharobutylicum]AQS08863.1 flagellar biosynthetic protein FliU [Clostridium saccharobutylicum]MBC2437785.1 lysine-N-methylase [Clostridium saccharobutylicum]NSB90211.1 lysine-N-methylase [Clostridium saccharobutylicum]NYC28789.1 lysine-N-methylase [Clostridium saccharobutylicum]OOM14744.1 flagellar biosynthetic protein FliU [Clostridium saccharobutylicum]
MSKVVDTLKITNYDKFKCIADKCRFTCCDGWDVSIDTDTYNKWKKENDKAEFILNNVKIRKCGSKKGYFINKENHEACPLLDKQGLCQVVKSLGEEYLSSTCHRFPRIENIFEDKKELSLSCACPEVVELISSINGKINIISENDINLKSNLLELRIREVLIDIMQKESFSLEDKLIVSFQMLLTVLEKENFREEGLLEELERYKNKGNIQGLIDMYNKIESDINDSVEEINYLFLDIIKNYKEVSNFEILLKDISEFAENIEIESLSIKWHDYKSLFEQYNMLIENCIVSDILSSCISDDIEEMTISFQMIAVEYLLVRYAVFLKYCMNENKEINVEDVKDYIVVFSRIIGNNTEAVIEFFREGFGEPVLEIGYLCFITLF